MRLHTRSITITAALFATLAIASCGTSSNNSTPASVSAIYDDADVTFATNMIGHHSQAVDMAAMVLERGTTTSVRALATRIKDQQDPEIKALAGFLRTWGRPVPTESMNMQHGTGHNAMGMMSSAEMSKLEGLSGRDLERAFLTDMIEHHAGAIMMSQTEITNGKYAAAKELANRIVAAQTGEIAEMRALLLSY